MTFNVDIDYSDINTAEETIRTLGASLQNELNSKAASKLGDLIEFAMDLGHLARIHQEFGEKILSSDLRLTQGEVIELKSEVDELKSELERTSEEVRALKTALKRRQTEAEERDTLIKEMLTSIIVRDTSQSELIRKLDSFAPRAVASSEKWSRLGEVIQNRWSKMSIDDPDKSSLGSALRDLDTTFFSDLVDLLSRASSEGRGTKRDNDDQRISDTAKRPRRKPAAGAEYDG